MCVNGWCYFCIILYPICFWLPHNLHQLNFLNLTISGYVTLPSWLVIHISPNRLHILSCIQYTLLEIISFLIILFRRQIWSCCLEIIIAVLLEVWHHCKFTPPPPINYLLPSVSICCRPCSFLLPVTYHIPFICYPPPTILPEAIFGPYPLPRNCWTTWDFPAEVPMTGGSHTSVYCPPFPPHKEFPFLVTWMTA